MVALFVGRQEQLSVIAALGERVRVNAGPAAALFLSEPGEGKSRLLAEARRVLRLRQVINIVGYEPERRVPLAAASDLLRHLTLAADERPYQSDAGHDQPAGRSLEPVRVFETALRALNVSQPTLIAVDDVQWIDDMTLALLHYLVRGARDLRRPVILLAAARPSDPASRLERSLATVLDADAFVRIDLMPLSREDGVRLLRALVPEIAQEQAIATWEEARGSPFWLETLAQSTQGHAGAAEVMRARIRGAGSDAASIVNLLVAFGRPVTPGEVGEIEDWPQARVEAALDELDDRGLVVRQFGSAHLAHDLIRTAAALDIPVAEGRRLHRRIAETIEAVAGDDVQLLRGALEHRHEAGQPVLDLALRLARSTRRRWLGREGAVMLAAIADEADPSERVALALGRAVAGLASELGDHELGLERWRLVAERTRDGPERARAALAAAKEAYHLGRSTIAREWIARCRASVGLETTIATDLLEAMIEIWLEYRLDRGWDLVRRALVADRRLIEDVGGIDALPPEATRIHLEALEAAWTVALQSEDWNDVRQLTDELLSATASDERAHADALILKANSLRIDGRFRDALDPLRTAWSAAQRLVLPGTAVHAGYWLATTLADLGELEEAEGVAHEATALAARVGDYARLRARSRSIAHEIALLRGDWRAAAAALLAHAERLDDAHARIAFHQMLATWLSVLGGPTQAAEVRDQLAEGERLAERAGCLRCRGEFELYSAEALTRIGQPAAAENVLRRWQRGRHRPEAWQRFQVQRVEGLLRSGRADLAGTVEILRSCIAEAEHLGRRLEATVTRLDLGRALLALDRKEAVGALREAGASAEAIGAHTLAAAAERELRALGVRTWRRGTSAAPAGTPLERLTEREREVAVLVAAGLSNPEIAKRLFLSRKTIERHVSNILGRLGATNRTELAVVLGTAAIAAGSGEDVRIEGVPR